MTHSNQKTFKKMGGKKHQTMSGGGVWDYLSSFLPSSNAKHDAITPTTTTSTEDLLKAKQQTTIQNPTVSNPTIPNPTVSTTQGGGKRRRHKKTMKKTMKKRVSKK